MRHWAGAGGRRSPTGAGGGGCDDGEMPTLTDLALRQAGLAEPEVDWLHMLLSDWQLLADLSFADLVLWAQLRDGSGWVALAQIRPVTAPTAIPDDIVGSVHAARELAEVEHARPRAHRVGAARAGCDRHVHAGAVGLRAVDEREALVQVV